MSTAENQAPTGGYGYASDEVKISPFNFGLNQGDCYMTKCEWIPNGGKEGAEGEALDIIFTINKTEKNYRMFPVTKAFGKNNEVITDPNATEFKEALIDFNARVTHILHAFVSVDAIKAAMGVPINSFKEFCTIVMGLLPKNYKEVPLDIFLQFQWTLPEGKERTYLEIPKKMKDGRWLVATTPNVKWKEVRTPNPDDGDRMALHYVSDTDANIVHPFVRNGYYMNRNYANQQKAPGTDTPGNSAGAAAIAGTTNADGSAKPATTW